MGITCSPLPKNNGNLPLPFFGGKYPIVLLDNIYQSSYMYIKWFTWIIFFHFRLSYTKKLGVTIIIQFYQRNGKLPLPWLKQGYYPVIPIYDLHM